MIRRLAAGALLAATVTACAPGVASAPEQPREPTTAPATTDHTPTPPPTPETTTTPPSPSSTTPDPEPAPAATTVSKPDPWRQVFNRYAARYPAADWRIRDRGAWGMTDVANGTVWIAPRTPLSYLDDVMRHEWLHVQQGRVYGTQASAEAALAPYGGIEIVADCGAIALGATWSHYTRNCTPEQSRAGRAIANGETP